MNNNYKIHKNILKDYIYGKSEKEYSKQTINGLFRAITEPLIDTPIQDALIFLRIVDIENLKSTVKRLTFSGAKVYSFNSNFLSEKISNIEKDNLWGTTEFVLVLAQRYSVAMIWDYGEEKNEKSDVCLLYNARSILDIAKIVCENSKVDFSAQLKKFLPDRRENVLLNTSIRKIADINEDLNTEMKIKSFEAQELSNHEKNIEQYENTADNIRFISHEIKNHISVINLYTKIASKRLETISIDEEVMSSLKNCTHNVQYSSDMIAKLMNDLKCFSNPEFEDFCFNEVLEQILSASKPKSENAGVSLNVECPKNMFLYSDRAKLNNVLLNLVFNAIEACDCGGKVDIEVARQNNYVQILVKDTGSGILTEDVDKIFDIKFTTKENGNGLGLAICRSIIKALKGQLNLVTTSKKGTTFEILLPEKNKCL